MTPIIAPIDLTIADIESGGATLTFTPLGEPSATYHLTTDTVRVLVDALAGVVVPLPGEVRVVIRVGRETKVPPLRTQSPATPCATEAPRDVATDPRVGDRVTVGGWLRTVEAVEPGRILVYSGPHFYLWPKEWAFLCQMPGAVIERAEDRPDVRPDRDVALNPKVGDRVERPSRGRRVMVDGLGRDGAVLLLWWSTNSDACGVTGADRTDWAAMCREAGAVIERAPK